MSPSDSHILILAAGLYSSIQDIGRKKYRSFGVPISGAMDKYSMILANKLLNNDMYLPVMEMTMTGAKMMFENDTLFVITGADMSPELNGTGIDMNRIYPVTFGDVLSFGKLKYGTRAYIGVKGGFLTPKVLDSYAYYKGITPDFRIEKGNRLPIATYEKDIESVSSKIKVKEAHFNTKILTVTEGPEFDRLTTRHKKILFKREFEIDTLNNRMGYQLKKGLPRIKDAEIITSSVIPGTVQLTPSGKLIIMMRDCPTTGGYPRILQLTDDAINQLAQKKTGDRFSFEMEGTFSFLRRLVGRLY